MKKNYCDSDGMCNSHGPSDKTCRFSEAYTTIVNTAWCNYRRSINGNTSTCECTSAKAREEAGAK